MLRHDPREQILAQLNRVREERLDCDPSDHGRYETLTEIIDGLLERLSALTPSTRSDPLSQPSL